MKRDLSEKLLEWSEKIRNQKLSQLSEKAWCKEQAISHNTFQYWKKQIKSKNQTQTKTTQFIEITEERPWIKMSLQGAKLSQEEQSWRVLDGSCGLRALRVSWGKGSMIMMPMMAWRWNQRGYFIDKFDSINLDKSLTRVAGFG